MSQITRRNFITSAMAAATLHVQSANAQAETEVETIGRTLLEISGYISRGDLRPFFIGTDLDPGPTGTTPITLRVMLDHDANGTAVGGAAPSTIYADSCTELALDSERFQVASAFNMAGSTTVSRHGLTVRADAEQYAINTIPTDLNLDDFEITGLSLQLGDDSEAVFADRTLEALATVLYSNDSDALLTLFPDKHIGLRLQKGAAERNLRFSIDDIKATDRSYTRPTGLPAMNSTVLLGLAGTLGLAGYQSIRQSRSLQRTSIAKASTPTSEL